MIRRAVIGSRDHLALAQVWQHVTSMEPCTLVSGGADGVDTVAEEAQLQRGGLTDIHVVTSEQWQRLGKRAGHVRNGRMVESGLTHCDAFPWGATRGTLDMIAQCEKAGVPVTVHAAQDASLLLQSARINYRGKCALDVTRKSGKAGLIMAPSWGILNPAIVVRKKLDALIKQQKALPECDRESLRNAIIDAMADADRAWDEYVLRFTDEMRRSWRSNRDMWVAMLSQSRLVLCCFCNHKHQCHRHLLRAMLVKAGEKIGRRVFDGGDLDWAKWEKNR